MTAQPDSKDLARCWLYFLETALSNRSAPLLRHLLKGDSYWRDVLCLRDDIGWEHGGRHIASSLLDLGPPAPLSRLRLAEGLAEPRRVDRIGRDVLEVFFDFDCTRGYGRGVARLIVDDSAPAGARLWSLLTSMCGSPAFPDAARGSRHPGVGYDRRDTARNWLDHRAARASYTDHDPEVLIVGGGHAGLSVAARLQAVGVDVLVVDRHAQIGDNWRRRYKSLALHSKADVVAFPYLPFPTTFPTYIPKDRFANWLATYVDALDLNYWPSTDFMKGRYNAARCEWEVKVRTGTDAQRVLRPRHVVLATGMEGGEPHVPSLPGLGSFRGNVLHTATYEGGSSFSGQRVLVVGTASSGHDVAQDLHHHGAKVTMLQRSPTTVISLESSHRFFAAYTSGATIEEADLLNAIGFIHPLLVEALQAATVTTNKVDEELHRGLERAGFRVDDGEDHTGYIMKLFRYGGRYYINVGCSDLIVAGDIAILQYADLKEFVAAGAQMVDSSVQEFDTVILATGYANMQEQARRFFGDDIAGRVGKVGGFDSCLEYGNLYKPTAQDRLWFAGGGIPTARFYSLGLALMIRADLDGLSSH